jgi:hypothetical protein
MTIGKEKKVFANAVHLKGLFMIHYLEIQCGNKIGTTQGTARVAALATMNHTYYISPDLTGKFL